MGLLDLAVVTCCLVIRVDSPVTYAIVLWYGGRRGAMLLPKCGDAKFMVTAPLMMQIAEEVEIQLCIPLLSRLQGKT